MQKCIHHFRLQPVRPNLIGQCRRHPPSACGAGPVDLATPKALKLRVRVIVDRRATGSPGISKAAFDRVDGEFVEAAPSARDAGNHSKLRPLSLRESLISPGLLAPTT